MKRFYLWPALALVLAVNALALTGVAYNRADEPEAAMTLSERELPLVGGYGREENSGVSLRLEWNWDAAVETWFDAAKLTELGMSVPEKREESDAIRQPLPKQVFVVLEYEGEAWRRFQEEKERKLLELEESLKRGETQEDQIVGQRNSLKHGLYSGSRLFPVAAGLDPGPLRQRYPDNRRYLIVPALARATSVHEEGRDKIGGMIDSLLVAELHVPLNLNAPLLDLAPSGPLFNYRHDSPAEPPEPRYEVDVRWGRRLEPWVTEVRRIEPGM